MPVAAAVLISTLVEQRVYGLGCEQAAAQGLAAAGDCFGVGSVVIQGLVLPGALARAAVEQPLGGLAEAHLGFAAPQVEGPGR